MQFSQPVDVKWLATFLQAELVGDSNVKATGINEINRVEVGDIVFVDHPKYYEKCLHSSATIIIINTNQVNIPTGKCILVTAQPFEAYLKIAAYFRPFKSIHLPISETAIIGEETIIMQGAVIGNHVKIGKRCIIHPNTVIMDYSEIGDDVIIQAGTIIGSDAFYYNIKKNREVWPKKMLSCGKVVIENNVEIGANCTIDRGVTAETIIGKGTIIDNLVHIGHDVVIGNNCLIAAQVGIAGATTIESGVTLWGQVGVSKTLTIGANAVVLAQSGVPSSLEAGKTYFGYPAQEASEKRRELVWIKRIPAIWKKVME